MTSTPNTRTPTPSPSALRNRLEAAGAKHDAAARAVEAETAALEASKAEAQTAFDAQNFVARVAASVQHEAHVGMAAVVSKCLSAVFERPYELRVEFEKRRGKTEADFVYLRGGHKLTPRQTSGGVLAVAGVALRLAELVMTLPPPRRFLALDEPFRGLSGKNLAKMGVLVETLADELDVQMLICTHDPNLMVGTVIEL